MVQDNFGAKSKQHVARMNFFGFGVNDVILLFVSGSQDVIIS